MATAFNMFIHNPIFGLGFGRSTFLEAKMAYITSFGPVSPQFAVPVSIPHNEFLHILVLTGVVGFVPYLLILVNCARMLRRAGQVVSEKAWFAREFWPYLAGIYIILLINAASADVMWFSYLTTLHFFLFGVLANSLLEDGSAAAPARAGPATSAPPR
jgi:O-antigen ligase